MSADRAPTSSAVEGLLERLPSLTIVVGKGGVGKTTCAIGLAAQLAAAGEETLLVATDPAGSLAPALGVTLAQGAARRIDEASGLSAMQLDPAAARAKFLDRWRDVLITIIDRGTYLDIEDIGGLVDASFPGADEIFGLLVLAELISPRTASPWTRFVVDTAPTGHTLRLLGLPETFDAMISLLDSMQAKHRFMVSALTHRYRQDAADEFLEEMRRTIGQLREALGNRERAAAVLVTRAEPVVMAETVRYVEALRRLGIAIVAVIVEAVEREGAARSVVLELENIASGAKVFVLPRIDPPPVGLAECERALDELVLPGGSGGRKGKRVRTARKRVWKERESTVSSKAGGPRCSEDQTRRALETVLRSLTIVAGKGGVGKTTVSCALAIVSVLHQPGDTGETLLVSTDPAPSTGDALGIATPRWAQQGPEPLEAVPRLLVWQMDATTGFRELRHQYRERIDAFFDAITGGSVDIAHDRAILRELLALAPPGIDELYALASLGEAIEARRYARIIVDPAPTGHLLRLFELPALALDWSHRLMRLIMKYKEFSGLVDAAEDLVKFSRRTRAFDRLLRDPAKAGVVLVSLDEPAVIAETKRLSSSLAATGVAVVGQVRNCARGPQTSSIGEVASRSVRPTFVAPEVDPAPIGVAAIRAWCECWRLQD